MLYLLLAIASSAMVSIMMRLGEGRIRSNMMMFVVNYLICILLSRFYMKDFTLFTAQEGIEVVILLGLLSGILYLVNFVLLQKNIQKNGMVLSSTFMKLGVMIPILMAILVFQEEPKGNHILGILLAVSAIILIHFEKNPSDNRVDFTSDNHSHTRSDSGSGTRSGSDAYGRGTRPSFSKGFLLLLLFCGGITDSMANIYDHVGNHILKDHYLFYTFVAAFLCALLLLFLEKKKISGQDVLFGILVGVPNYYSARFLLLALNKMKAVIVYPVYSVATIVVISLVSVFLFREKISRQKGIAILIIFAALILLNL